MSPGGRPPVGRPINLRLPPEMLAAVDSLAADYEVKRAEMIRILIRQALAMTERPTEH